jgi:hypothetical protein
MMTGANAVIAIWRRVAATEIGIATIAGAIMMMRRRGSGAIGGMDLRAGTAACLTAAIPLLDDHGMMMMAAERIGLAVIGTDGGTAMITGTGGETTTVIVIERGSETETAATGTLMIGTASPGVTGIEIGIGTLVGVDETIRFDLSSVERMYHDSLENTIDTLKE